MFPKLMFNIEHTAKYSFFGSNKTYMVVGLKVYTQRLQVAKNSHNKRATLETNASVEKLFFFFL